MSLIGFKKTNFYNNYEKPFNTVSFKTNIKARVKSRFGFTLAEVLITLGIIGIVAALTMPALMVNIKSKVLDTQNKKARNTLTNGIKMLMASDNAAHNLEETSLMDCNGNKTCIANQIKRTFKVYQDNTGSNAIFNQTYKIGNNEYAVWTDNSIKYAFVTPDGIMFGITPDGDTNSVIIIVDVNGKKSPNEGGKDLCKYTVTNNGTVIENCSAMETWAPQS